MKKRTWAVWGLAGWVAGCVPGSLRPDPNAENVPGGVERVAGPKQDRCERQGTQREACVEEKYLGTQYVRRLSVGDEVCLEGGFGEVVGAACKARAAVIDTAPNLVKLEVRGTKPDSRWFQSEMRHAWYEEGALVDLYLAERGY